MIKLKIILDLANFCSAFVMQIFLIKKARSEDMKTIFEIHKYFIEVMFD